MRFIFLVLSLVTLSLNAQIYNKAIDYEYNVTYYPAEGNMTSGRMILQCTGKPWEIPTAKSGGKKERIKDSWLVIWKFFDEKGVSVENSTGVTENKEKIFLHPPRMDKFGILEYTPFPRLNFPLSIGKIWSWDLNTGGAEGYYSPFVKGKVEGDIIVKSKYEVKRNRTWLFTHEGISIDCVEIVAVGKTQLGDTKLTSYFSPVYGFVYFDFEALDGSRFIFELRKRIFKFQ